MKISFTYSDGPNLLQVCVFGPRENSSYLTVSYEALGGLFISSSFSASLPHFPFFLFLFNPKHCFRRHHFFRNAKLVYAETQESTEDQLYIQLKKTLPSAGIEHGSSQSKSDHASHSATVNPQTEGYIYE